MIPFRVTRGHLEASSQNSLEIGIGSECATSGTLGRLSTVKSWVAWSARWAKVLRTSQMARDNEPSGMIHPRWSDDCAEKIMKTLHVALLLALSVFFRATVAQADLVPPGGEGVGECRDKKAGDKCQNYLIIGDQQQVEPGTCVEEKLDHLHFKFKAHLRCVSASVPRGSASATAPPPPSVAPTPSAAPSVAPAASSAAPVVPAAIPSASPPVEPSKSSGCFMAPGPFHGETWYGALLGMGVLVLRRRMTK